jgi:hypothetical protein
MQQIEPTTNKEENEQSPPCSACTARLSLTAGCYHPLHSFNRTMARPLTNTSYRQPEQPWRNQAPQKLIFKD